MATKASRQSTKKTKTLTSRTKEALRTRQRVSGTTYKRAVSSQKSARVKRASSTSSRKTTPARRSTKRTTATAFASKKATALRQAKKSVVKKAVAKKTVIKKAVTKKATAPTRQTQGAVKKTTTRTSARQGTKSANQTVRKVAVKKTASAKVPLKLRRSATTTKRTKTVATTRAATRLRAPRTALSSVQPAPMAARKESKKTSVPTASVQKISKREPQRRIPTPTPATRTRKRATAVETDHEQISVSHENVSSAAQTATIQEIPARPKVRYSDAELEEFRYIIEAERHKTLEELRMLRERLEDLTDYETSEETGVYSMHMAEQGSEAYEREKTYAQIQRMTDYLRKLDEALKRIEDKTYGICRVCGILIAKERLRAVPITTLSASWKLRGKCPVDGIDRVGKEVGGE